MSDDQPLFSPVVIVDLPWRIAGAYPPALVDAAREWAVANEARVTISGLAPEDFAGNRFSVAAESTGEGTAAPYIGRRVSVLIPGLSREIEPHLLVAEVGRLYGPLADAARLVPRGVLWDLLRENDWAEVVHPGPDTDPGAFARLRSALSAACREWRDAERSERSLSHAYNAFCAAGLPKPAQIDARFEAEWEREHRASRRFWELVEAFQGPHPARSARG